MIGLLIKRIFRSKVVSISLGLLLLIGIISIVTGRIFLDAQQANIDQTIAYQEKHLDTQLHLHNDDLGLLLYYLKFTYFKQPSSLAGISIGQSDLQSNVQHVKILNLEGQKYNTDLVNPVRLQVGNLDLSFTIIFLLPLVIITLMYNLYSEEAEGGTWTLIKIQGERPLPYLLKKAGLRFALVSVMLVVLFLMAQVVLQIPMDGVFMGVFLLSFVYMLFWFVVCFGVILFRLSSGASAITLLTAWLCITILIPMVLNNYISNKYPIDDAFAMTIKSRDAYHKKWDSDKRATMDKFYAHYPQFSSYELQEEGFSWLWYYAMQQMGDDESVEERTAFYQTIKNRENLSTRLAQFVPSLQLQLSLNDIAQTSLSHHVDFLDATTKWHERARLGLYPKIFDGKTGDDVEWSTFGAERYSSMRESRVMKPIGFIALVTLIFIGITFFISQPSKL